MQPKIVLLRQVSVSVHNQADSAWEMCRCAGYLQFPLRDVGGCVFSLLESRSAGTPPPAADRLGGHAVLDTAKCDR